MLRAHQRDGYGVLMQATAAAIIELARDPRYVGGTLAVLAVLHTWTQQLNLHPHVHCLVSGGGISDDGSTWDPARRKFLLPIKALAKLVRGKFRALLQRKCPDLVIPAEVWNRPWILHVTAWGKGEQAVLDYLARYVFRIALTNARIVELDDQTVTIQYKERKTDCARTCRLSGQEFIRRFLQHVLPRGFHKGSLLRPVASRSSPRRRSGAADDATSGATPARADARSRRPAARVVRRRADAADRADDLSALSPGADDLHPSADPPAGHGTMIRRTGHQSCSGRLSRVSPRRQDPLSPAQFIALVLTQTMRPTILKLPSTTAMLRSYPQAAMAEA